MRPLSHQMESWGEGEERGRGGEEGRRSEVDGAPAHLVWLLYRFVKQKRPVKAQTVLQVSAPNSSSFYFFLQPHYC